MNLILENQIDELPLPNDVRERVRVLAREAWREGYGEASRPEQKDAHLRSVLASVLMTVGGSVSVPKSLLATIGDGGQLRFSTSETDTIRWFAAETPGWASPVTPRPKESWNATSGEMRCEQPWVLFDKEPDDYRDGLRVGDESLRWTEQGRELRFNTAYETEVLTRSEVEVLTSALVDWLARTAR